jgi:hypothetical protein
VEAIILSIRNLSIFALHQALVLSPICVPEKVGVEGKWYSQKK